MSENEKIEESVVALLQKKKYKVTTAESCTGGLLSGRLVNVSGASEVLEEGFITYSDRAKQKLLGVCETTLKEHTAVSKETAKEMAEGGCKRAQADCCVSVTGFAGPGGGTEENPAGTVYIGCCVKGNTMVERYQFTGDRQSVREQAVEAGLRLLYRSL